MKKEVGSAVDFLTQLMRPSSKNTENLDNFNDNLKRCIAQHYENHWFPEKPFKGSGYRCLRINHQMEPIILQAATESGLTKEDLLSMLPNELTLWIDPREVSYRIGEDGSVGVLYEEEAQDTRNNNKNKQRNPVSAGPSPVTVPSQSPVPQNRVSPVPVPMQQIPQQMPQQRMSPVHLSRSPVPMGSPVRTSPVPRYLQCSPTRPSSTTSSCSGDFAWDSLFDQQTSRYHQLAAQFQQHQLQQQQQQQQQLNRHQNHQSQHSQQQQQHSQYQQQQQQCGRDFFHQANLNEAYDLKRLAAYVYS